MESRLQNPKKPFICVLTTWRDDPNADTPAIFVHEQTQILSLQYDVVSILPRWCFGGLPRNSIHRVNKSSYPLLLGDLETVSWSKVTLSRIWGWLLRLMLKKLDSCASLVCAESFLQITRKCFSSIESEYGKPDIIHAHAGIFGGWLAAHIGNERGIPVVLSEHSSGLFSGFSLSDAAIQREAFRGATRVTAVSPALAEACKTFGLNEQKLAVIPNPVNDDAFCIRENQGKQPIILTISTLTEVKNIPLLLSAFKIILSKDVKVSLVIGGGEIERREHWKNYCTKLELPADSVQFIGNLSRAEVCLWMQRCSVFVLTSRFETFSCVTAEAQACGKPVVSTRCGGPEWIVTPETGLLVKSDCANDFAGAVLSILVGKVSFCPKRIRQITLSRFGTGVYLDKIAEQYALTRFEQCRTGRGEPGRLLRENLVF